MNCKKRTCVKVRRYNIIHILKIAEKNHGIVQYGNGRNFYDIIVSRSGKQRCLIKFDDLTAGEKEVHMRRQNSIKVVESNEEQVKCDHSNVDLSSIKNPQRRRSSDQVD